MTNQAFTITARFHSDKAEEESWIVDIHVQDIHVHVRTCTLKIQQPTYPGRCFLEASMQTVLIMDLLQDPIKL